MNGPDFLGIGVSRAGTTYLYDRLRAHPQVWMPPLKELHFFDRDRYGWPADDGRSFASRCRLLLATVRRRKTGWKERADVRFAWRYLGGDPNAIDNYRRCFPEHCSRVRTGEITPDYCELEDTRIAEIKSAFPNLRLILTLRHPLHRFESQVYKYLDQTGDPAAVSHVWGWLGRAAFVQSFNYAGIVHRWRGIFGPRQLHLAYFERLEEDSDCYFDDICRFLGIDTGCVREDSGPMRRNSSRSSGRDTLPEDLLRAFSERILRLYSVADGAACEIPDAWRRDLERLAAAS